MPGNRILGTNISLSMLLRPLPDTFNFDNEITPPAYHDHFLFVQHLQHPYECPECPSNIGLLMTAGGACNYYINSEKNQLGEDKVFFISRGSTLAVKSVEKEVTPVLLFFHSRLPDLVMFSMQYGGDVLLERPYDTLPYDFSFLERVHVDRRLHETVTSLIPLGNSCSSFDSMQADTIVRGLFEDLLIRNEDAYKRSRNIQVAKASTRLEIFKRISTARDWMEANYCSNSNLEHIASVASMNSQHFLRMFKQVYNITPHQYLIDLKLKKARQLLENNDLTINDICQSIGFESTFSFSVLFKSRFGLAPTHYRKA
jgi:AraC-like DNA-binding protein